MRDNKGNVDGFSAQAALVWRLATVGVEMPRLTREPWFGPKRYGWGLSPVSWQGWLATLVFVVVAILAASLIHPPLNVPAAIIVVLLFVGLTLLTGTKPGGPGL